MIDLEINSLEDAYINIAKEEEKLFQELSNNGMRRYSQIEKVNAEHIQTMASLAS